MPETIITWVGSKGGDAQREATRLAALHPSHATLVPAAKVRHKSAFNVIIVSHRSDLTPDVLRSAADGLAGVCSWIILAACESSTLKYFGTLSDKNDLLSPAQFLANRMKIKVTGTTRPLTFDEVGKSLAFARSGLINMLVATNYGTEQPWQEIGAQSDVEELTTMLGQL